MNEAESKKEQFVFGSRKVISQNEILNDEENQIKISFSLFSIVCCDGCCFVWYCFVQGAHEFRLYASGHVPTLVINHIHSKVIRIFSSTKEKVSHNKFQYNQI